MYAWKSKRVGHGALFCLQIIEIRQSLEKSAQMVAVEPPFKALPTKTLRIIFASQLLHHIEAHLFPFKRNPTGLAFVCGVDRCPGLLQTARIEKSTGDFRRNACTVLDFSLCCAMKAY